jgi:hypothetical protein
MWSNNANTTWDSHCKLEIVHKHPNSKFGIDETKTFSSQPINFQLNEIEVYQKRLELKINKWSYNFSTVRAIQNVQLN